jgi:hypothetical protein
MKAREMSVTGPGQKWVPIYINPIKESILINEAAPVLGSEGVRPAIDVKPRRPTNQAATGNPQRSTFDQNSPHRPGV